MTTRSDLDFRYTMPDGTQVEAFQMTEATRYQEGLWPEWMNSKMLLTSEDQTGKKTHYLNINDAETEIPEYGWVVNNAGRITAVPYEVMELATKVARVVPKVPDVAKPQPDNALRLAAKIMKRPYDEVVQDDLAQVEEANRNRQAIIDMMHPEDAAEQGFKQSGSPEVAQVEVPVEEHDPYEDLQASGGLPEAQAPQRRDDLILELCDAYEDLWREEYDKARVKFRNILSQRVAWCNCAPGQCAGLDPLICRQESPLAK